MKTLPFTLPAAYKLKAGQTTAVSDVDTGGYDVLIGGLGFRLATDTQFPYIRETEPTTVRKLDTSTEVGEQTLSQLPWLKSQSSFHAGAGQLNLEAPFTAFQYQQEQIAHLRYDMSLGVDPWTPGQVKRLPDTTYSNFGFNISTMVTAVVNGVDVAIVGGSGSLYQVSWSSGPDAAPTITAIDLTSAVYGGMSNCSVSSLTTDGRNYYGILQLTTQGSKSGVLTYVISGQMESSAAPVALYDGTNFQTAPPRTNLCTNPSFETNTTGWTGTGSALPTLAQSATQAFSRTKSMVVNWAGSATGQGVYTTFATTAGQTYTLSAYVYVPAGSFAVTMSSDVSGYSTTTASTSSTGAWQRISYTINATGSTHNLYINVGNNLAAGTSCYIDAVLVEQSGSVGAYFDGATAADSNYSYSWTGTADASTSKATPVVIPANAPGVCGWVKERLIGTLSNSVYELPTNVASHSALPTAKFTHPVTAYKYTAISESPDSILVAGAAGLQGTVLRFKLDTSANTPTLGGGATIASLPTGEQVQTMAAYLGSFVAIGTNKGVRVGSFDTYTGNFTYGPLSVTTTAPVYGITGRDRFVYAGYTNQQADGSTGLVRIDLSQPIDASNRLAWAPDLRPASSAPQTGTVYAAVVLPQSGRLMFATNNGFYVEGNGPGSSGAAWLRTSRIRYNTDEPKLFKSCRIHGTLDQGTITISAVTQFGGSSNLGTFGYLSGTNDPGLIQISVGLQPWVQLQFQLNGSGSVLNSYVTKSLPAPTRQRVITLTVNCFRQEVDRYGLDVTDPVFPRDRYNNLKALESTGAEVRFVEFTNLGPVATLVVIDQVEFHSFSRPSIDDDFGGYLTLKLRETQGS